ncbi:MAG: efflux RND transporter periplasmic adaptor subunit [Betaproteobacteria bacterium]|nr:efflux RND transporter periplasmic adaptor subunit [Betaproteobacteria bacterium]
MLVRTLLLALLASTAPALAAPLVLTPAQVQSLGIESATLGEANIPASGKLPARVLVPTGQLHLVAAPVAGLVETLAAAPGLPVRRGQVLASLSSPQALEFQRDSLQAASQSALLQQALKRDEQLFAEGLIAESRLQASRAAATQASLQARERGKALDLAGIPPGKLGAGINLLAPIDGVILEQGVQIGQRIEAATVIYRVAQLSPLWLEIQAPLALAGRLREGMAVRVAGTRAAGKLIAIGRAVDPASQTVLLRATVTDGAAALTPGQMVEAEIEAGAGGEVTLPAAALARHDGRTIVFVQTPGNAPGAGFAARPVRVLGQGGDIVTVDGVRAGEIVVVRGASSLKAMLTGIGRQ